MEQDAGGPARGRRARAIVRAEQPVFLDITGARWRTVKRSVVLAIVIAAAVAAFFLPRALVPDAVDDPTVRRADTALLDSVDRDLPVIGRGVMLRVFRVEYDGGQPYAADPFTRQRWRDLTQADMQMIGYSQYAVERFSQLPNKQIALTFDDGPDIRNTPQLLDLLSKYGARATFFDTGANILRYPDLFKRTIREGHLVGNHTYSHVEFADHGSAKNIEEIVITDRVMRSVGGYGSKFFRLPYGGDDRESVSENSYGILLAQQTGHYAANFDIDTNDWEYKPGQTVPMPELDGKGHVLLLHDGGGDHSASLALVERLLKQAQAKGYTFVTMQSLYPEAPATAAGPVRVGLTDRLTHWALYGWHVLPALLVQVLFVLGAGTMAVVSVLTVILAIVASRRRRKRQWPDTADTPATVVIAAYNEATVIRKTLDSLRHSTYPHVEILVLDDGSTDGTADVVRAAIAEWAADGRPAPALRVISQPNGGKSAALNRALAEIRTDIVVTFDADTVVLPETVGLLVRHFADDRIGAVAGTVKVGNRRGLLTRWQSLEYLTAISLDRSAQGLLGAIMIVPGACAAWRRSAVLAVGGFDSRTLAEDCDLTLSLQRARWRIEQEPGAIAYTEVPQSAGALVRQRFRWMFGTLQSVWKQRRMLLRPRYGALGLAVMPYAVLSILVPLLFMPLAYWLVIQSLLGGDWQKVLLYLGVLTAFHFVMAAVAVVMAREKLWHLLVVPVYRLIYEPLRTYLLYSTALAVLRGRLVGWNKLVRTNTVTVPRTAVRAVPVGPGGPVVTAGSAGPAAVVVPVPRPSAKPRPVMADTSIPAPAPEPATHPTPVPRAAVQRLKVRIPASRRSTSRS